MRFVILSDIHGNFNALKECLNCIEKSNIDAIILCGDYVTDFPGSHDVIEIIQLKYDSTELIQELKSTSIYNDELKWGKLLEKELKTGEDIPLKCIDEYEKIREEHHLTEESLEAWNIAVKMVLN